MQFKAIAIALSILVVLAEAESKHSLSKRQAVTLPLSTVCSPNPCTYGDCEILSTSAFQCHCLDGITGTNCNTVAPATASKCAANPCYGAGSVCVPQGLVSFTCFCAPGLTGPTCRSQVNTCNCNGGTCILALLNGVSTFTCSCPAGFGGEQCQFGTLALSCQQSPCLNGGSCTITGACACPSGFTG